MLPDTTIKRNICNVKSIKNFDIPRANTESYYRSSFFPATAREWNSLPEGIQSISDLYEFKERTNATTATFQLTMQQEIEKIKSYTGYTRMRLKNTYLNMTLSHNSLLKRLNQTRAQYK